MDLKGESTQPSLIACSPNISFDIHRRQILSCVTTINKLIVDKRYAYAIQSTEREREPPTTIWPRQEIIIGKFNLHLSIATRPQYNYSDMYMPLVTKSIEYVCHKVTQVSVLLRMT